MKKMIKLRNSIIIVLSVTILLLCIGFVVMALSLKYQKDKINTLDVSFTEINKSAPIKGSTIEPIGNAEISDNGKIINMSFSLNAPHDEITYTAIITNKGTLPAKIADIVESPDYSLPQFNNMISPVSIKISDIKDKVIKPDEELELKVVVYYSPSTQPATNKTFSYKLGLIASTE